MTSFKSKNISVIRCGRLLNQHHISTLLSYLQDSGNSISLFALQCPAKDIEAFRSQYPGINVINIGEFGGRGLVRFLRGGITLARKLHSTNADVHYVIDSWTLRYYSVARMLSFAQQHRQTIYHTFDMLSPAVAAWYERLLERHWAKTSNLIVVTDPSRSALMQALYRLASPPITLAVRLPRNFRAPLSDVVSTFRSDILPEGARKLVVSPTRLSSERMGIEIIEAFAKTPNEYALVTYEGSPEYTLACTQAAKKLGISDRILILPETNHAEVMLATAASDAALIYHDENASLGNFFCHPSRLAYCVAMGIPVVANDVPVIAAVVYRYGLGTCVKLSEKNLLAKALVEICSNDDSLAKLKSAIISRFHEDLCFEIEGEKLNRSIEALPRLGSD